MKSKMKRIHTEILLAGRVKQVADGCRAICEDKSPVSLAAGEPQFPLEVYLGRQQQSRWE